MRQSTHILQVSTKRRGLVEITAEIRAWVERQSITSGLLTVFCQHTSAPAIQNAAPEVRTIRKRFRPAALKFRVATRTMTRSDDMPAHLRTALTQVQLSIPVMEGLPALGPWQGIYVFEHRRRPHERQIIHHELATESLSPAMRLDFRSNA
jgi:secondary thiamine-phosphate synthase enzyme